MNFLEAQKPLLNVLKFLGFFTYSVKSDVTRNRCHYVHCVIMNVLTQGLFVIHHKIFVNAIDNYLDDGNRATNFFTTIEGYCVGLCYLIVYYSVFVCSSSQFEFIKTLLRIEREIRALKFSRSDYNARLRKTSFHAVTQTAGASLFIMFFFFAFMAEKNFLPCIIATALFLSMAVYLNLVMIFVDNLVNLVGNLADELNLNFQNCVTPCPFHFFNDDLKATLKLHDRLVQSIATFNRSFGIIVLGTYMYCFLIFTFECYFAYAALFDASFLAGKSRADTLVIVIANVLGYVPLLLSLFKIGFTSETSVEKV